MSTGHSSIQAPQVVQAHNSSAEILPFIKSFFSPNPNVLEYKSARMSVIIFMGDSSFPLECAGQTVVHLAHSVQATESSNCFQVKSDDLPTPREISSSFISSSSMSAVTFMLRRYPRSFRLVRPTFTTTAMA